MKIDLDIDDELMASIMKATGESTKNGAMNAALREYLRQDKLFAWMTSPRRRASAEDYSEEDRRREAELQAALSEIWNGIAHEFSDQSRA